jgi:Holliday junction resolvase RusA-like endonuclease
MSVEFFLPCEPPTVNHQSGRVLVVRPMWSPKKGRMVPVPQVADSKELKAAKQAIEKMLMPYRIPRPISGPVKLTVEFTWPWRQGDSKRVRAQGRLPKTTRPDATNTAKTFEDRLVATGFLEDDNQVTEIVVRKWFGDTPGIKVTITPFFDCSLPLDQRASA